MLRARHGGARQHLPCENIAVTWSKSSYWLNSFTAGTSQRTVENHRASIMEKTGSKSLPALARLAFAASDNEHLRAPVGRNRTNDIFVLDELA